MEKNKLQAQEELKNKQLEEFLSLLYNFKYPIFIKKDYYNNKKRRVVSNYYYTNGIKGLFKNINSYHNAIYMSVCSKYPEYTEKGRARNTENNTAYANFFVVDIDAKYALTTALANKIINIMLLTDMFKNCPKPTAITKTGAGLHFYYVLKKPVYFGKSKYKEYFKTQYKMAVNTIKEAVNNNLMELKNNVSDAYLNGHINHLIFKSLNVDSALCGSLNQLIRIPGSFNFSAKEQVEILFLEKNNKYLLGNLITEYNKRYTEDYKFQDNILPAQEYTKLQKRRENKNKKDLYNIDINPIILNNQRLIGLKKLIKKREDNGNLEGTRQKIMCQAAWCLININYNAEFPEEEVYVEEELQEIGDLIGGKFARYNYINSKIRCMERYHVHRNKLSNKTICKWLEIKDNELKEIPELWTTEGTLRIQKKKKKAEIKHKAYVLWCKGETQKNIAVEVGKTERTIKNWVKEWKDKVINI